MIGGPPIQFVPPPVGFAPPRPVSPQPTRAAGTTAPSRNAAPPAATYRGQSADESRPASRPAPLVMPSPEQLGVTCSRPTGNAVDWAAVHRRLDELGAAYFQMERLPAGGCRLTCLLPTGQPGRNHRVEAQAATETEAVRAALAQVEKWVSSKK